jgi:hypothetical protein
MLYQDGKPAHYNETELRAWLKSMGVGPEDILPPGIVPIPEREGGLAVYVNSSALGRVQQKFPRDKQGVTTGYADKVNQPGETVLIDFTPSGYTDIKSTQPIDNTVDKLRNANAVGVRSIVITARKADGVGEDFHGKPVKASNADDMRRFLAQQGAEPTDGVLGVTGQNKGNAIISKYLKGEDPPEEIHFYDDLEKNTNEVEDAIALKEPSELHIYGPGDFAHGRADPYRPRKSYPEAPMKRPVTEAKKQKGLWHNMRQRRKKGLPRKKPGQKGYPKTLDLGEAVLRSIIRREIMEAGEMFAGMDLMQMQTTQVANALETALMDLEDVGCPDDSEARFITDQVIDMVEKMRNRPDYDTSMLPPVVSRAVRAVRTCKHIPPREAEHIAEEIEMALDASQEIDRY